MEAGGKRAHERARRDNSEWVYGDVMSQTSRSPIHVEESTRSRVKTGIPKESRTSEGSSAPYRSSRRHVALVEKLAIVVKVLELDADRGRSLLGAFPGVLEGALLRFLGDARRREHRPGVTSSTRRGHFMDSRDRGRSNRAERETASQESVKARKAERDLEFMNRGA